MGGSSLVCKCVVSCFPGKFCKGDLQVLQQVTRSQVWKSPPPPLYHKGRGGRGRRLEHRLWSDLLSPAGGEGRGGWIWFEALKGVSFRLLSNRGCTVGYNDFDFFWHKWLWNGILRHISKIHFSFFWTIVLYGTLAVSLRMTSQIDGLALLFYFSHSFQWPQPGEIYGWALEASTVFSKELWVEIAGSPTSGWSQGDENQVLPY